MLGSFEGGKPCSWAEIPHWTRPEEGIHRQKDSPRVGPYLLLNAGARQLPNTPDE